MLKRHKQKIPIFLALIFFGFLSTASARQPAAICPGTELISPEASLDELVAIQKRLEIDEEFRPCGQSADFLWLQGLLSLKLGQFGRAASWLELSLLQMPNRPGVLLDFALAQESAGELEAALAIYKNLLENFEPTNEVRGFILRRADGVEQRMLAARERRNLSRQGPIAASSATRGTDAESSIFYGQVALSAGYDSNLNSASSIRALNFTIEDQVYEFPISENDLPKSGRFTSLALRLSRREAMAQGYWGISFRQSLRIPEISELRSAATEVGLDISRNFYNLGPLSGELLGFAGFQAIALDKAVVTRSARAAASFELSTPISMASYQCARQFGIEAEARRFPGRQVLDGDLLFQGIKLSCSNNVSRIDGFARFGQDRPLDLTRAGGIQQRQELGVSWLRQVGQNLIRAQSFFALISDRDGYNPLIQNNIIRKSRRRSLLLEWAYRFDQSPIEPYVSFEKSEQISSIDLFSFKAWQIQSGLRWNF